MPKQSGQAVYKAGILLGKAFQSMHRLRNFTYSRVENHPAMNTRFTQPDSFLYTFFAQFIQPNQSVNSPLVHIFHNAYKEYDKVNEGIF